MKSSLIREAVVAVGAAAAAAASAARATPTLTTLATFNSTNGANPYVGPTADAAGNLYGTTADGTSVYGTVYVVAAGSHALTTLATFNYTNGASPYAGLTADAAGNLYGTTAYGGASGDGTVFEVAVGTHAPITLATFNSANGLYPFAGLTADAAGNLYGTTAYSGASRDGTVFEVAAGTHALTDLATFNFTNGAVPFAGLTADAVGNLYVRTANGGPNGDGTVFEVAAGTHALTTLPTFNATNGANPEAGLTADAAGSLYGTTANGGANGDGTVFEVAVGTHALTTLATFNATNGATPEAGLTADAVGNLYGTTEDGGANNDGTVFELTGTGFAVPEPASAAAVAVAAGLAVVGRHRRRRVRAYWPLRSR